jgi:hypothetical protein
VADGDARSVTVREKAWLPTVQFRRMAYAGCSSSAHAFLLLCVYNDGAAPAAIAFHRVLLSGLLVCL